jgi:hypothetical protein
MLLRSPLKWDLSLRVPPRPPKGKTEGEKHCPLEAMVAHPCRRANGEVPPGHSTTHRCRGCGCVSHWVAMDSEHDRMGVNVRLMDPEVLAVARVHHLEDADTALYTD